MKEELIAPCGMNCRLCYGYIRPKGKCSGCRAPCDWPCRRLKDLDKRYSKKYHMSMMENLAFLSEHGMEAFLRQQEEQYCCPACGETLCVHRDECPSCKTSAW